MLTLRQLEFELKSSDKVIQNLKWKVIIKSKFATWWNWTWNDKPKILGHFGNGEFILNPVLKYWISHKHSLILIKGSQTDEQTIKIKLKLSFAGITSLIFNFMFIGLLFIFPDNPTAQLFVFFATLALGWNFYLFYRDLNKTDELITRLIIEAEL